MANRIFIKTDKNGTKIFHDYTCTRCGGQGGSEAWKFTGYTCYKCGGSGIQEKPQIERQYTPEHAAKLHEKAVKRAEDKIAEQNKTYFTDLGANQDGNGFVYVNSYEIKEALKASGAKYNNFLGWVSANKIENFPCYPINLNDVLMEGITALRLDEYKCFDFVKKIKSEQKEKEDAAAGKKPSEFVGTVNEKFQVFVKSARFVTSFGTQFGVSYLYEFIDENDNILVYFTSKDIETEKVKEIRGTVKEHKLYNNVKQTVITRCKIGE